MKKMLIAAASALALAAGSACTRDNKATDNKAAADNKAADYKAPDNKASGKAPSAANAPAAKSMSGDVQSVDVPAMAITIVSPTGDVQRIIVAADATVSRDGTSSSLDQVKQGDNVRASFDANTDKASRIDVKSKGSSAPAK
jgi:Cu/Ag efflux protein CusF